MTGVAIVTGAGSGLGRCIARALLGAGWQVAAAGRRERELQDTVAGSPARSALAFSTDIRVPESVAALFEAVRRRWGRLDLLVNNAGVFGPAGAVDEISCVGLAADGRRQSHRGVPMRPARGADDEGADGPVAGGSSTTARSPRTARGRGAAGYTATKHAITGLTKSLALDGREFDIACGQIDIGNAATEMTRGLSRGALQADGSVAPEPTFDPQHVADAVLFMAALPLDANVQFMTIAATKMPFIGRG